MSIKAKLESLTRKKVVYNWDEKQNLVLHISDAIIHNVRVTNEMRSKIIM